jgi:hypothetical protein
MSQSLIHEALSREVIGAAMQVLNFKSAELEWKRVIRSADHCLRRFSAISVISVIRGL